MREKNPTANSPELSGASDGKLLLRAEVRDSQWPPVGLREAGLRAAEEAQQRLSIRGEKRRHGPEDQLLLETFNQF